MSTIIIASLIILAVLLGIRHYIKQKGSCGDCNCSCPIKDEMKQAKRNQ
ncbi:FeoB-associated Cys-rich membrane protein [Streptococcus orisasini]|nr:FeoB-associated Cys-rich membrane protein [Streptococcus orisasini]